MLLIKLIVFNELNFNIVSLNQVTVKMSLLTQPLKINNNLIVRYKLKIKRLTTQFNIKQYFNFKFKKIINELIDTFPADVSEQS